MNEHTVKKLCIILAVAITVTVATFLAFAYTRFYYVRDLSIAGLVEAPESYDGTHVKLHGYIVEASYTFGPKYVLKDNLTKEAEIPLGGKEGPEEIDLEPYVSFVWHARFDNYTKIRDAEVAIVGYVYYTGSTIDAPSYYLEVETIRPPLPREEAIEISRNAKLVKEGLAIAYGSGVDADYYNSSMVERLQKSHLREIFIGVPEGHAVWEVTWMINKGVGGYLVIVIIDAETGTIIHETMGVAFD